MSSYRPKTKNIVMNLLRILSFAVLAPLILMACKQHQPAAEQASLKDSAATSSFEFVAGYPTNATVQKAYDAADLNRAIQCYRFFYPSVSILGTWEGNLDNGVVPNATFAMLNGTPEQLVFTPNSDTKYAGVTIDLSKLGPMVIEVPPGPIMSVANDLNQLYVMDIGLPGPDKGKGGKHILLPPDYKGNIPSGFNVGRPTTNRVLVLVRAIPPSGGDSAAEAMIRSVKVYPLHQTADWKTPGWVNLNKAGADFTPLSWEDNIKYWQKLHELISSEPPFEAYRFMYGELSELGIEKGKPFAPDARMKAILERAAKTGNAIMRVQSFADRRSDKFVWKDRQWEWAVLRSPMALLIQKISPISMHGKNGSTRHKLNLRQCSIVRRAQVLCIG